MEKEVRRQVAERERLLAKASEESGRKKLKTEAKLVEEAPLMAEYPVSVLGSVSESFLDSLLG